MAVLRTTDRDIYLPDRCLIGRSRACDLVLDARDVSGEHAVIEWSGARWELRDLGSRNGTQLGELRVLAGASLELRAGAQLRFGRESPPWSVVDVAAPQLMARSLVDGQQRISDGGYLALPGADDPTIVIFQDRAGRWICEQPGLTRPLEDRAVVELGEDRWRVHLPAMCARTWEADGPPLSVAHLRLRFAVSRDEEYIELVALAGERRIDLQARAHHYLLLMLARRRLADRGLPDGERGWIRSDELADMLKLGEDHLSITIHRARQQLGRAGITDAAALIERRAGTRQLRLGVDAIEIAMLADRPRPRG